MKPNLVRTDGAWRIGLAATLALSFIHLAAGQPRATDRPRPERFAAAAARFGPGFDRVMNLLTDEQRASLREAMEDQRESMREWEEKIRVARMELFSLSLSPDFDEEKVRAKSLAAAKGEAELTVLRAKAFSKMRPALSGEQLRELRGLFPGMENRSGGNRSEKGERDEHDLPVKK